MFVSKNLGINEAGHLTFAGLDTTHLAKEYGTPLYLFDEDLIRENINLYKKSIQDYYNGNGMPVFASKAFCCKAICRVMQSEGIGLDVVSGGELYTALSAGFDASNIFFHGNNKTRDELVYAVESGVGTIVVDNLTELALLDEIAGEQGREVNIMFRVKPGIDAHTHQFVMTGQIDSKFGLALENGEAMAAAKKAIIEYDHVDLTGLHCHIGSQIFELAPFEEAAKVMMAFMADIKKETGKTLTSLNLGGGFGIKYLNSHDPVAYGEYMHTVSKVIHQSAETFGLPVPRIYIEPGRSIVGPAGITLYTVGAVKEIAGVRNYVSVDGGMADNPRYALYQSPYDVVCANKISEERSLTATIAGRCCESGDLIQEHVALPETEAGDILAVLATGAYNYSMASHYNRIPNAAVVFVSGGKSRLAVRRETYEDLTKNDL